MTHALRDSRHPSNDASRQHRRGHSYTVEARQHSPCVCLRHVSQFGCSCVRRTGAHTSSSPSPTGRARLDGGASEPMDDTSIDAGCGVAGDGMMIVIGYCCVSRLTMSWKHSPKGQTHGHRSALQCPVLPPTSPSLQHYHPYMISRGVGAAALHDDLTASGAVDQRAAVHAHLETVTTAATHALLHPLPAPASAPATLSQPAQRKRCDRQG